MNILAYAPVSLGDWTSWIQFGVLGVVTVGFVLGKIVPGYILQQRDQELAAVKAELNTLRAKMEDQVIPALTRTNDILARLTEQALSSPSPPRRR